MSTQEKLRVGKAKKTKSHRKFCSLGVICHYHTPNRQTRKQTNRKWFGLTHKFCWLKKKKKRVDTELEGEEGKIQVSLFFTYCLGSNLASIEFTSCKFMNKLFKWFVPYFLICKKRIPRAHTLSITVRINWMPGKNIELKRDTTKPWQVWVCTLSARQDWLLHLENVPHRRVSLWSSRAGTSSKEAEGSMESTEEILCTFNSRFWI